MEQFSRSALEVIRKYGIWIFLLFSAVLVKWASFYPDWVEANYTYGIYPVLSSVLRFLFGWIPLSIGDWLYAFVMIVIIVRFIRFLKRLLARRVDRAYCRRTLTNTTLVFLALYVSFNFLWGLNYDRLGIPRQLHLEIKKYNVEELDSLVAVLENKINFYAELSAGKSRDSLYNKSNLFAESDHAYRLAADQYPFLQYRPVSVKPSLFSYPGNVLGFQGYYNPFSGEAQVNTTIPVFIRPFVTCHEIGHQVGYAKENEANFAGFLACRVHPSPIFRYSVYFDMFNYAIGELRRKDSLAAKRYIARLAPQVKKDYDEMRRFFRRYENPAEDMINWFYGNYLKANNQPAGKETYSQVVAFLIAYQRKYGKESI